VAEYSEIVNWGENPLLMKKSYTYKKTVNDITNHVKFN